MEGARENGSFAPFSTTNNKYKPFSISARPLLFFRFLIDFREIQILVVSLQNF